MPKIHVEVCKALFHDNWPLSAHYIALAGSGPALVYLGHGESCVYVAHYQHTAEERKAQNQTNT